MACSPASVQQQATSSGTPIVGQSQAEPQLEFVGQIIVLKTSGLDGPKLRVTQGSAYTIGRSDDADICIKIDTVSARHARLVANGREVWLHHLSRTNDSTTINGVHVSNKAHLRDGDIFSIATRSFRFECAEAPQIQPSSEAVSGLQTEMRLSAETNKTIQAELEQLREEAQASRNTTLQLKTALSDAKEREKLHETELKVAKAKVVQLETASTASPGGISKAEALRLREDLASSLARISELEDGNRNGAPSEEQQVDAEEQVDANAEEQVDANAEVLKLRAELEVANAMIQQLLPLTMKDSKLNTKQGRKSAKK